MRILFGITGGISAFKAVSAIRLLTELGHQVKVVPTKNALRFVGATTLEALSHNVVDEDLFTDVESVKHVTLGQEADLVIVAPASASFIARYAAGIADDLLGNALLATKAPVVIAPAMHTEMWQHASTRENVSRLVSRGVYVIEPDSGRLTGSDSGKGRLPEPAAIVELALGFVANSQILAKKKVVVTAGGTREPIDPVRYIGNYSSGNQGLAIAYAAVAAGAEVTLIAANLELSTSGIHRVVVANTALEMKLAVETAVRECDVLVMTAAVADFRVERPSDAKIKRHESAGLLELKLVENPDILKSIVNSEYNGLTVGFAAETAGSLARLATLAEVKLAAKGCDLIVANDVSNGAVFGSDRNQAYILSSNGESVEVAGTKAQVAVVLVAQIAKALS